ncbi:MAG: peptidoglycan DD-metalloendopeptidase family protein [Parcubacteria group bacterium]|nr:peptidoglycan DD-metalloendopeptidase family protein [Parcubacteria group bacterium]
MNSSVSTKLFFGLAVFIFLFISGMWLVNLGNSVSLDSDNKEIVEEFNASESSFFSKILPQESPVASALVFAGSLEERLYGVFRGTASNSIGAVLGGPVEDGDSNRLETVGGNSVVANLPVLTIIPASGFVTFEEGDVLTYEIEEGDSLESIAGDFGISVSTLISVNNMPVNTKLKPGDKLAILPVDGVKHTVKSGETIQNLALKYKADADRIIAFNDLPDNAIIRPGDVLIIPGGEHVPLSPKVAPVKTPSPQTLPNLVGYYGLPSGGRITFGLHKYNAVDIGGKDWCNTPIYAAAAGTIITADAQGWNGGYGKYIKIAHENGTITLYAHASQLLTSIGQFVAKGQTIALMGSTGRSTGCHVHFEVRGARNPLAR